MDGAINLKKHDEEYYSIYKDYEREIKKSTLLRFSCIEEKYLNLANNTQSPKYKELNKEFINCNARKKKLLSYLQDSVLSMSGDKNAIDQQKNTSDYFSLCSSYSKNVPDLVCESNKEQCSVEIDIDEDIPVSEIENFRHEKSDEEKLKRTQLQKAKRIEHNVAEHCLFRSSEEIIHSKNESVKFGKRSSSFIHNEKNRIQNDQEVVRNPSMNNIIKSKKNKLIINCNQETSESTKSNLYKIRKDKVNKQKNRQDINKSNCLPLRRSSRIHKNLSKTITYIKPLTPDELDEPLLKSDLSVKEKHIQKIKSCKPDVISNKISSETKLKESVSSMTVKDRVVIMHEKSFKNPDVCESFRNNMVATPPLTNVRKRKSKSPKRLKGKKLKAKDSFCFIKDISKNVKSSKYLVVMKNYDINISNAKRKNSEILCVLPLKSNHISNTEQINITDKLKEISSTPISNVDKIDTDVNFSEICSNPLTQSAAIQGSQNDQNLIKVNDNAKKENDAVEQLLLLSPVRSVGEQDLLLNLQLDFQDPMVPDLSIFKNKTRNRDFHINGDQVPKFSHCSMVPSIIEEENESSILLEELSNVKLNSANKSVVIQESRNQMTDNELKNKSNNLSKTKQVNTLTNTTVSNKYFSPNIKNGGNLQCKLNDLIMSQKMSQSPGTPLKKLLSAKEIQTSDQNINHISISHPKVLAEYNTFAKPTSLPLRKHEKKESKSKLKILFDENHNKSSNFFNRCQTNSDFQKSNSLEPPKKILKVFKCSQNNTIDINRDWKKVSYQSTTKQIFQDEKNKETKQLSSDVSSSIDTSDFNYSQLTKDNSISSLPSVLDGSFSLFSKSFRHMKENMMKEDRLTHKKTLEDDLFFPNLNYSCLSLAKNRTLNETLNYKSIGSKDAFSKSSLSKSNSQAALAPSFWLKSMLSSSKYGS